MVSRADIKQEVTTYGPDNYAINSDDSGSTNSAQLSGFGTIKFIETVRERPEVWDSRSSAYKVKDVKQHAWKNIAATMDPEFRNLSTTAQNVAVHGWMRRWKSLRDCYTREVSRNNTKKKKYIYFDHLSFLNEVVSSKSREGYRRLREYREELLKEESYMPEDLYSGDLWSGKQFLVVEQDDAPEEILSLQQLAAYHQAHQNEEDDEQPQPVAVFSLTDDEDGGRPELERGDTTADDSSSTERNTHCQDDSDRMFLLSLIPDLRKVPSHKKLKLKSKILSIIQEATVSERTDK